MALVLREELLVRVIGMVLWEDEIMGWKIDAVEEKTDGGDGNGDCMNK